MTAVEQLIEQLTSVGVLEIPQGSNAVTYIIDQSKEMEKQDKIEFADDYADQVMSGMNKRASEYYNETFKSE